MLQITEFIILFYEWQIFIENVSQRDAVRKYKWRLAVPTWLSQTFTQIKSNIELRYVTGKIMPQMIVIIISGLGTIWINDIRTCNPCDVDIDRCMRNWNL